MSERSSSPKDVSWCGRKTWCSSRVRRNIIMIWITASVPVTLCIWLSVATARSTTRAAHRKIRLTIIFDVAIRCDGLSRSKPSNAPFVASPKALPWRWRKFLSDAFGVRLLKRKVTHPWNLGWIPQINFSALATYLFQSPPFFSTVSMLNFRGLPKNLMHRCTSAQGLIELSISFSFQAGWWKTPASHRKTWIFGTNLPMITKRYIGILMFIICSDESLFVDLSSCLDRADFFFKFLFFREGHWDDWLKPMGREIPPVRPSIVFLDEPFLGWIGRAGKAWKWCVVFQGMFHPKKFSESSRKLTWQWKKGRFK